MLQRHHAVITGRAVLALLAVFFVSGATPTPAPVPPPYIQILSKPPKDLPTRNATQEDVAKFAWQEFLALNWKASVDATHPPSSSNPRGLPDTTWNHSQPVPVSPSPNPLVWQTYAQTTELRPNGPLVTPWVNLGLPKYSYQKVPTQGAGQFNLWNNLDEDNEIGSCDIYGQYTAQKAPRELVLFQVKVNRDEYEYIRTSYGADQQLPGGKLGKAQALAAASIQKGPPYAYYAGATNTCSCPPGLAICLPCGLQPPPNSSVAAVEGAIEVKSAWRRLQPNEDPRRFYTTKAIYYDGNGAAAYYNGVFALIGMHIIHKTTNFPDFVFATFEQVDVEKADGQYVVLSHDSLAQEIPPAVPIVRQTGQTNRSQMHPVPATLDNVTAKVRQQLIGLNPSTVWQYYRLTGVSAASTDCAVNLNGKPESTTACIAAQTPIVTQCTTQNPNYYMANFMVESDPFLNNFSGPGFANQIFGNCRNTVYANKTYNNGGCKGCHGVAQTAFGTDFSFLLDFGNNKPSVRPATIHYYPPIGQATTRKLKHYLDKVK